MESKPASTGESSGRKKLSRRKPTGHMMRARKRCGFMTKAMRIPRSNAPLVLPNV